MNASSFFSSFLFNVCIELKDMPTHKDQKKKWPDHSGHSICRQK
ncbi:hypothetical protein SD77_2201 [Bacillus badius]|uniref:Ribose 5-phosphate isomerase B n=1 Tax=Bacillus badius TaxID=1455 RepID=A0ABR5AYC6_BACBA|nr:hypothetical protein SD78_2335 [Bacillus badius]KIL79747.1 hypothetical protein SD77_2201 [Bacillus badius]